jgi:hypothetical protein
MKQTGELMSGKLIDTGSGISSEIRAKMLKGTATKKDGTQATLNLFTTDEINDLLERIVAQAPALKGLVPGPDLVDLLIVGAYDLATSKAPTKTERLGELFKNMRAQYYASHGIQQNAQTDQTIEELSMVSRFFWANTARTPEKRSEVARGYIARMIGSPQTSGHVWGQVGSGLVGGATDQVALAEELKDKPQFESNEQGLIAETITPGAKPDTRITGIHMGTEMKTVSAMRAGEFVPFAALKRRRPPVVLRTPGGDQWSTTMTRDTTSQFQNFAQSEAPRKITRLIFPKSHLGILKGNTSTAL